MPIMVNPVAEWVMPGQPFTREDRDRLPEDGHRYELVDGVLIVAPSPSWTHQRVVVRLATQLAPLCPPGLELLVAPFDVDLAEDTVVQPDVMIAPEDRLTERCLDGPPLLAIEVLSSSTRHLDLAFKRSRYEAADCPSCWVVDPAEPSVIAWELVAGRYRETCRAAGADRFEVTQPFPGVLVPRLLTN
jgi:Uma2 family endonuclease